VCRSQTDSTRARSQWSGLVFSGLCRRAAGGVVEAGPAYQKNLTEEMTKLQRLYGGGDLTKFPEFKFPGELDMMRMRG